MVHMVDTTEIADFLSGGEIAFTTGIGVSEKMSLLALVDRVYKNHASAMVVNIGPYVAEIPQEVIDFAMHTIFRFLKCRGVCIWQI